MLARFTREARGRSWREAVGAAGLKCQIAHFVPCTTGSSSCYDVAITVDRDGGCLPGPAEFAVAAEQAASARAASVMSAHTAEKIISIVTVQAADRARGRGRRPGRRLRSAKTSVCVTQPLSGRAWRTWSGGS